MKLKHILDLQLRNVYCAQVECQIKFNYKFDIISCYLSVNMSIDLNYMWD